jgi:hypothetical protein
MEGPGARPARWMVVAVGEGLVITLSFNMSKCFGFHASIHYFFSSACMQGVQSCDIHIGPVTGVSQLRPVAAICEISLSGLSNRLKRLLIQRFRSNDGNRISGVK